MPRRKRHLAALPPPPADRPTPSGFPVTIEIPTGNRPDLDSLIRELARVAFRGTLVGYEAKIDAGRARFLLTVQPMTNFDGEAIVKGKAKILAALVAVGALVMKPKAAPAPSGDEPAPPAEKAPEGDTPCPPSSPAD